MDLSTERCNPNIERLPPLTRKETLELIRVVPGWSVVDGKLRRIYVKESFEDCVRFLTELDDLAKREGHFPDVSITKGSSLEVAWYTYKCGGITRNDFIMASRMNQGISHR